MKKLFVWVWSMLLYSMVHAQECSLVLSGHVEDADIREKLAGAVVLIEELDIYTQTDTSGNFIFRNVCPGAYTIRITHVNCDAFTKSLILKSNHHLDVYMPHHENVLREIQILSSREQLPDGLKKELKPAEMSALRGLSLSAALSNLNGVSMLQTGTTISKPVIHGLHGSRILTIHNEVRLEGQQWGNEHAPEVDPFIADKLTVIKGADELRYGSDAIGGVILVKPKSLSFIPGTEATLFTGFFSANLSGVISGVVEHTPVRNPRLSFRLNGTLKRGADVQTPQYSLNNTAMEELAFTATAGLKTNNFTQALYYSFFKTRLGVFTGAHIGNLTDLEQAIAADKPDDVFLNAHTYTINRPRQEVLHQLVKWKGDYSVYGHTLQAIVSVQFNNRKEFDVVRTASSKPQMTLQVNTLRQDLVWEQPVYNGFKGTAGLSASQQDNHYTGRYFIPNYQAYTYGAFYIEKWRKHRWELQGGVRGDYKTIQTSRMMYGGQAEAHKFSYYTFGTTFSAIYSPNHQWNGFISFSLATRAPYVNELLSNGIHHGTATYEEGNPALKTEKSHYASVGVNYTSSKIRVSSLTYINSLQDFIYRVPKPENPILTIAGAFPLIKFEQTNALLTGADLTADVNLFPQWLWKNKISLLYAYNRTAKEWLIGMPSHNFTTSIERTVKDTRKFTGNSIRLESQIVTKQTRVPSKNGIRYDYKEPPDAYVLFNLYLTTTYTVRKTPITVNAFVYNMFNTTYRNYLNSMRYFTDEVGLNAGVQISIPLINKKQEQHL